MVAAAMLFSPAASGAHAIAMAADHHARMAAMEHCQSTQQSPSSGKHDQAPAESCCMAMCMTIAIAPSEPIETVQRTLSPSYFAAPQFSRGYLGEIATPPPRNA